MQMPATLGNPCFNNVLSVPALVALCEQVLSPASAICSNATMLQCCNAETMLQGHKWIHNVKQRVNVTQFKYYNNVTIHKDIK